MEKAPSETQSIPSGELLHARVPARPAGRQQLCAGVFTHSREHSAPLLCPVPELTLQHTAGPSSARPGSLQSAALLHLFPSQQSQPQHLPPAQGKHNSVYCEHMRTISRAPGSCKQQGPALNALSEKGAQNPTEGTKQRNCEHKLTDATPPRSECVIWVFLFHHHSLCSEPAPPSALGKCCVHGGAPQNSHTNWWLGDRNKRGARSGAI